MILVVCLVGLFILSVIGVLRFSLAPGLRSSYAGAEGAGAPAAPAAAQRTVFPSMIGGSGAPGSLADLVEKLSPAVVNISTTKVVKMDGKRSPFNEMFPFDRFFGGEDKFYRRFFGDNPEREFRQRSLARGSSSQGRLHLHEQSRYRAGGQDQVRLSRARIRLQPYRGGIRGRTSPSSRQSGQQPATVNLVHSVGSGGDWSWPSQPFGLDHTVTLGS